MSFSYARNILEIIYINALPIVTNIVWYTWNKFFQKEYKNVGLYYVIPIVIEIQISWELSAPLIGIYYSSWRYLREIKR